MAFLERIEIIYASWNLAGIDSTTVLFIRANRLEGPKTVWKKIKKKTEVVYY